MTASQVSHGDDARHAGEAFTVPEVLRLAAARFSDRIAIADGAMSLSYVALAHEAQRAARALIARGVEVGDRVAIWAPNIWEWVVAALATHAVGGVVVPVNTRYKGEEASFILARSEARVLMTVTGFLGTDYVALLEKAETALPQLRDIVVLRGDVTPGSRAIAWNTFLEGAASVPDSVVAGRSAAVTPDDLADIIFTSGTTGHPKGVMASQGQSVRAFREWSSIAGLRVGDRYLVVNPFFHTFGYKAGWLASLMTGATVLPHAVFDAAAILTRIVEERVSVIPGPPALYQSMLARPDRANLDLSALRLAVTGAASIPVELVHRMKNDLGFGTVLTAYGLTEATGVSTMCHRDDDAETIANTSGRAIPGTEVRVVDDDGHEVPPGVTGEITVRGYTVMRGYFRDPEATKAAVDARGMLRTGDIGTMDSRGNLKITDRKKDMFIVGGFNAYPAEIERILLRHDAIAQVAVVGAPDDRLGEVAVAYVVAKPSAAAVPEEIIAWSREHMANYKVPRRVELLDALPTNASGKVKKHELRVRTPR